MDAAATQRLQDSIRAHGIHVGTTQALIGGELYWIVHAHNNAGERWTVRHPELYAAAAALEQMTFRVLAET